ncbi:MAG TPA: 3-dehydroquinate synthase [Dissulfurispiraceae bacterium]|nr:3-dehydroquinate synthase [Dissulfurispiraceae bacterium]
MENVKVELGRRSYEIVIGAGILSGLGAQLKTFGFSPTVGIISNPTVFAIYGQQVLDSIREAGFKCFSVLVPDGEEYKDYQWSNYILTELLKKGLDRNSCIVALGGGVIGDITGFAASLYMRGIHFVQVPTTLLAQVDSSVGGKTGVNHYLGKNMIGTFYQPRLVWIDPETLSTLPEREILCGVSEVIKYGIIWDRTFFDYMSRSKDDILGLKPEALSFIIRRSCEIKAEVVSQDERESGMRAILNFGHTFGHAIETETRYARYLHGEAVGLGMCLEAKLAVTLKLLDMSQCRRIEKLVADFGLPCKLPVDLNAANLLAHMHRDKKAVAGKMIFVLPENIGKVILQKGIRTEDIGEMLKA